MSTQNRTAALRSEQIITQAPMSFAGSRLRLQRLARFAPQCFAAARSLGRLGQRIENPAARIAATAGLWAFAAAWLWIAGLLVYPAVGALIAAAWMMVLAWYGCFGLLLVPYRLVRRSSRRRRVDEARHRELLDRVGGQA